MTESNQSNVLCVETTVRVDGDFDGATATKRLKLSLSPQRVNNGHVTDNDDDIVPNDGSPAIAAADESSADSSSSSTAVIPSTPASDSEIEILSSDDEELLKKRDEAKKENSSKAKQVLSSIKKLDIKALSGRFKLSGIKTPRVDGAKEEKTSSDGNSPIATSSPSCASEEEDHVKKEENGGRIKDEEDAADWNGRNGDDSRGRDDNLTWKREGSATTENSSRCSSPCEDPLEGESRAGEGDEEGGTREALTAESVREGAIKNAAIDAEYNVKNILNRLKSASLKLNNVDGVRSADDAGIEIVEAKKDICEIILESSDEEDDKDEDEDVMEIDNPIKVVEQTQVQKVAEQLTTAGVTVKNALPKLPRQLFPKWQTIHEISSMEVTTPVKRPVKNPPPVPKHLKKSMKVLSLFDGISGCLVALKQLGIKIQTYASSETDEYSKIVTMVRHPEVTQLGDARGVTHKVIQEHGPFDLVIGGLPCNDFEHDGALRGHRSGMHFDLFVEISQYCAKQHKKAGLCTPFYWLFYNVDLTPRHRDRISSALFCEPVKLDAVHVSPMRKPDFFWSNIPDLEMVLKPFTELDRMNLQDCLEPDRVARVRRLNTLTGSFDSMRQGPYDQVPINHGGELDDLWMVEVERVLGFPNHYTDVANLPPKERLAILAISGSVPIMRHALTPLKKYFSHSGS